MGINLLHGWNSKTNICSLFLKIFFFKHHVWLHYKSFVSRCCMPFTENGWDRSCVYEHNINVTFFNCDHILPILLNNQLTTSVHWNIICSNYTKSRSQATWEVKKVMDKSEVYRMIEIHFKSTLPQIKKKPKKNNKKLLVAFLICVQYW